MDSTLIETYFPCLLKDVEKKFGARTATTKDFTILHEEIRRELGDTLALSTLKRLWGYVGAWREPRISSLDLLSRYVGFKSFQAYVEDMMKSSGTDSSYSTGGAVDTNELPAGLIMELTWLPNRRVRLRKQPKGSWLVEENDNSKLKAGSFVWLGVVAQGEPLIADVLFPDAETRSAYVAGKVGGIRYKLFQ